MSTPSGKQDSRGDSAHGGDLFVRRRKLSRLLAMQILYGCDVCGEWETLPADARTNYQELMTALAQDDESFTPPTAEDVRESWKYAMKLVDGVRASREELDKYIEKAALNWKLSRMGSIDRAILRIAVYEMLKVDKVKPATAIDEAVELAKSYVQGDSPRFVNGILDKVRRLHAEEAKAPAADAEDRQE